MTSRDEQVQTLLASIQQNMMNRRQLLKRGAAMGLAIPAVSSILAACGGDDAEDDEEESDEPETDTSDEETEEEEDSEATEEPAEEETEEPEETDEESEDEGSETSGEGQFGGTFYMAQIGEPPTLDIHWTTATAVAINAWQMYETLFTWDENLELMMDLADNLEVSDDGLTNTVTLREGVNFHNGDVMTSEDVVASIERWGGISGLGGQLIEAIDEIEVVDDVTINFHMVEPLGAFSTMLARQNQGCGIYPKSVIDESSEESLADHIGTGPFMLVEHVPDRHVHYQRFEDYTARSDAPSGYGGEKIAYFDEMYFVPVPDESARISGIQSGEYHYLESIIPDHFESLEEDENVVAELLSPTSWGTMVMNMSEGIMSNQQMRQAVLATLNVEEMALAGYGEGYFRLDPGVMLQETAWHSTVSEESYNQGDPDQGQQLADEFGYDGETIHIMGTQEYAEYYGFTVIAEQQLSDAGFTVETSVVDWATLVDRRDDPSEFDIFTTGITFRIDPIQLPFMQGTTWPGWWATDEKVELTAQLQQQTEFEERYATWEELQALFYEQVPLIKVADVFELSVRSPLVQGFDGYVQLSPSFWNVWFEGGEG